ncbi:MAG TPA: hypothetical protein VF627_07190 [Abditibacterium sp.]
MSASAQAAAKQYVVIVAEGLSPQVLELGESYLRVADEDAQASTSFDELKAAKTASASTDSLSQLQGLLEAAAKSGTKTGLVTTGDLTAVAPLFYDLKGDAATALTSSTAKFDFLAGGGRAKLGAAAGEKIKAAGGSYLPNSAALDAGITGRVLAPQAESDLDYALDRDPETQAGLAELATLALDTLGVNDTPFVLIIHDTLLKKALETRDSPALFEQFRELDSIMAEVSARRDDNEDLAVAVLLTGGAITPRFSTKVEAEQRSALRLLSHLPLSYAGAGRALQGADADAIAAFADPADGPYQNWKPGADVIKQIAAGTLDPETAIRAYFEPLVKIEYAAQTAPPMAYVLGIEAPQGLTAALKSAVAAPLK